MTGTLQWIDLLAVLDIQAFIVDANASHVGYHTVCISLVKDSSSLLHYKVFDVSFSFVINEVKLVILSYFQTFKDKIMISACVCMLTSAFIQLRSAYT